MVVTTVDIGNHQGIAQGIYYVEPAVLVPGLKDKLRLVVQAKTSNGFKCTKPCTYIMKSW